MSELFDIEYLALCDSRKLLAEERDYYESGEDLSDSELAVAAYLDN